MFESREDYEALIRDTYNGHQPVTAAERHYLDDMIYCDWILRRLRRAERDMHYVSYAKISEPDDNRSLCEIYYHDAKRFGQLQWRIDSTRRAYDRAFKALAELKTAPRPSRTRPQPKSSPQPSP